jgi:hypothetical protein
MDRQVAREREEKRVGQWVGRQGADSQAKELCIQVTPAKYTPFV